MRKLRGSVVIAWLFCITIGVDMAVNLARLLGEYGNNPSALFKNGQVIDLLFPLFFAIPAALVISRHPRNVIGWLLMTPTLALVVSGQIDRYLAAFQTAPPPATFPNILLMWISGVSWLGLIMPVLLIPLVFPTGRPLTPRWRWPVYLAAGMVLFFLAWAAFTKSFQPEFATWTITNPIGFITDEMVLFIMPVWDVMLAVLTAASLVSIVVRYRRASTVEREQMKWLLYACAIFVTVYIPSLFTSSLWNSSGNQWIGFLFVLTVLTFPLAIAAAILRYHLFDIDVIIRLTLVYALVTVLLALIYAGAVILLETGFRSQTGQTSDIAVVISTLAIAALFTPLRLRIQAFIDRRFYRQKYNSEQALAEFSIAARSGSDLEVLTSMLEEIIQKTLQPSQVSLHLAQRHKDGEGVQRG